MNLSGFKTITCYLNIRNFLIISPLFFLTIRHWTNSIVIITFLGSLYFLAKQDNDAVKTESKWRLILSLTFACPFLAVVMGQILRREIYPPNFDAPLRLLICIPIFLAISRGWLAKGKQKPVAVVWLESMIPLTLLWTLFFRLNWPTQWGVDLTTYFVDPLTFGSYCLIFSIFTMIGLSFRWNAMNWRAKTLSFFAALGGVYLSLTSGSRTGWINVPVFLLIWAIFFLKPKLGSKNTLGIVTFVLTVLCILVWKENYLLSKFSLALSEINNYKWNEMNADTSVGLRISFYRMGYYYFWLKPIVGWGDLGWMQLMNSSNLQVYASEFARLSPKHGFHNEILTSAVRSGIWGFLSATCFYFIFIFKSAHSFLSAQKNWEKIVSFAALIFMMHLFVSGMTTEITNLVFLTSFIGLTLSVFMGELIYQIENF